MSNILHGSGAPLNANGNNGDYYRNTDNQDFWFKVTGIWDLIGNLNLSTPDGVGTVIFSGAGKPLNANGSNGNYYRNTDNNDLWYREGGIWKLLGSLQTTGDSLEEFSRWEFPPVGSSSTTPAPVARSDSTPSPVSPELRSVQASNCATPRPTPWRSSRWMAPVLLWKVTACSLRSGR